MLGRKGEGRLKWLSRKRSPPSQQKKWRKAAEKKKRERRERKYGAPVPGKEGLGGDGIIQVRVKDRVGGLEHDDVAVHDVEIVERLEHARV